MNSIGKPQSLFKKIKAFIAICETIIRVYRQMFQPKIYG